MHTPTRSACRPLSSLALMAALGALPLAAAAQQGTPAASAPASVAPQAAGQPAPQPAPQNVAQTASQPGSQTSGQGGAQPSAASPAAASAVTSPAAPAVPSAAGSQAAGQSTPAEQPASGGQPASAVQPATSGQHATSGQPAASGQTTTSGQPTAAGQPATPGQPAASGQPATSGQTTVSGQIPSAAAGTPAAPQATPQPAGNAQPALSPAASSSPPARLPSTGTPPTQPANSANRLPAAPDTADTAKQARNCYVPDDLLSEPGRLPGLSAALVRGKGDLLVIMLGSESTNPSPARPASIPNNTANSDAGGGISSRLRATLAAAARNPLAERLQERLIQDLGPLPGRTIHVESVGRRNSTVAEQASLINKQVLPRKPALVIWNLGRTDTRRGLPPANMARALDRGLEQLRRQHIDTIVMDPPYHPQFEAFYRTDDYRQYIRWTMNLHDQPYLQRYDMIDYWASTGRIDLDSGEPDRQAAAVTFTETCIAYQLSRMIDRGLSRK